MIGIGYNKEHDLYQVWRLRFCKCNVNHVCKEFLYASNLEDCLKRLKEDNSLNHKEVSHGS